MKSEELFEKLENTDNHYSSFKSGIKYVYFSTGGYSVNEELIQELEKERIFNHLLYQWTRGGHYKFVIPLYDIKL